MLQQHSLLGPCNPRWAPFTARPQLSAPRPVLHTVVAASASAEPAAADDGAAAKPADGIKRVPISELPKPHPKAQKALTKSMSKTGMVKAMVDTLNSVSFTIACDDQELGWEVAQGLAKRIGWFPVNTGRVLAGMHKVEVGQRAAAGSGGAGGTTVPRDKLVEALGSEEKLAAAELEVIKGMRTQKRVVICTLPSSALAPPDNWKEFWGNLIIWVDEDDKSAPKPKTLERKVLSNKAEILVQLKKQRGFAGAKTAAAKAQVAVDALMKDLVLYLNDNPDIVENKHKYAAYGCRGDWPVVQPPEWSPVVEGFERKPLNLPDSSQGADNAVTPAA